MHTGWDDEQQRKIDTYDWLKPRHEIIRELTAENAKLRAQLAEAVGVVKRFALSDDTWQSLRIDKRTDNDNVYSYYVRDYRIAREFLKKHDTV